MLMYCLYGLWFLSAAGGADEDQKRSLSRGSSNASAVSLRGIADAAEQRENLTLGGLEGQPSTPSHENSVDKTPEEGPKEDGGSPVTGLAVAVGEGGRNSRDGSDECDESEVDVLGVRGCLACYFCVFVCVWREKSLL